MSNNVKFLDSQFSLDWVIKSTPYIIKYRKAFKIEEIDDIFCNILKSYNGSLIYEEFASILGFNLIDSAENEIYDIYLNKLKDYDLINLEGNQIVLLDSGYEAITTGLKYKYFQAETNVFNNDIVTADELYFPFSNTFNLNNRLKNCGGIFNDSIKDELLINKLQFQLFEDNVFNGEILEAFLSLGRIDFTSIKLTCKSSFINNSLRLKFYYNDLHISSLEELIDKPENSTLKEEFYHRAMQNHILMNQDLIHFEDVVNYKDLWNWNDINFIQKVDWNDQRILPVFKEFSEGSTWYILSQNIPIDALIKNIVKFKDYWYWPLLTKRIDNDFLLSNFSNFPWDFEELSYKEPQFVIRLLSDFYDDNQNWDWLYLSENLPDKFIQENIENFPWDYFSITKSKHEIFKNTFIKFKDNLEVLISKNWDWKFISENININFLYKNIEALASKINWEITLNRFFNNEDIIHKCISEFTLAEVLKLYLPNNFRITHQNYIWSVRVIDFFENLNLINWETTSYSDGFDTNEYVNWDLTIFEKYKQKIISNKGLYNVSTLINNIEIIKSYREFSWDAKGLSINKNLINDIKFVGNSFVGSFEFSDKLEWGTIINNSSLGLDFWNTYLDRFTNSFSTENQIDFWKALTKKNSKEFIFNNIHYPWDWDYLTLNASLDEIIESLENEEIADKWNWKIATTKFEAESILENLEDISFYIDWEYVISNLFSVNKELRFDSHLIRIATCLFILDNDYKKEMWSILTRKYSFEELYSLIEVTEEIDIFQWDWDYISAHNLFPTDVKNIQRFRHKINWTIFSESPSIIEKFTFSNWDLPNDYYNSLNKYLDVFRNEWNWKKISLIQDINFSRKIVLKFIDKDWDWQYLSEFGGLLKETKRDNKDYLIDLLSKLPKIDFALISKRTDIVINNAIILALIDKNWDWNALSSNRYIVFDTEFIEQTKNKPWNWKLLAENPKFEISNEIIRNFINKSWDWESLSLNTNLEFNKEFIEATIDQAWNWKLISKHKSFIPSYDILTLLKNKNIDWDTISSHNKLEPSKQLLAKFEDKLNWKLLTYNDKLIFDINLLDRFIDRWDWDYICKSGNLKLDNEILNKYSDFLNWDYISSNTSIQFSEELINSFEEYWNWTLLKNNIAISKSLKSFILNKINNSSILKFLDKIEEQSSYWKGYIYHFSHIDNAVEIIKSRKIQSRNLASIKGDAAGSVVHRRDDAHNYARFYFRPQTPTQFYNEFLGKDINDGYNSKFNGWVSWYEKSRELGFPKCPIPIFFKFSLKEVLVKRNHICCVSNGNMQTSSTKFGSIENMIDKFGFDDLYYTPQMYATKDDYNRYRNFAQQEFLIKDEFLFDDIFDFEIICPTENDRNLLINLLDDPTDDILSKIVVDSSYYNNENPRVLVEEEENEIHIKNKFNGNGYFELIGDKLDEIEILSGDVKRFTPNKILFDSYISIKNIRKKIKLCFIDESDRKWFIYSN